MKERTRRLGIPTAILVAGIVPFILGTGPAAVAAPKTPETIRFVDMSPFDSELSESLGRAPERVRTTFVSPVNANRIPPRLDKWLYMVEQLGGEVTAVGEGGGKGAIGFLIELGAGAYELARQAKLYAPAINYDATVYYDTGTGNLTRVEFTRKPDTPPPSAAVGDEGMVERIGRLLGEEGLYGWVRKLLFSP